MMVDLPQVLELPRSRAEMKDKPGTCLGAENVGTGTFLTISWPFFL